MLITKILMILNVLYHVACDAFRRQLSAPAAVEYLSEDTPQERLIIMAATVSHPIRKIERSISNDEDISSSLSFDNIMRSHSLEDQIRSSADSRDSLFIPSSLENRNNSSQNARQTLNTLHNTPDLNADFSSRAMLSSRSPASEYLLTSPLNSSHSLPSVIHEFNPYSTSIPVGHTSLKPLPGRVHRTFSIESQPLPLTLSANLRNHLRPDQSGILHTINTIAGPNVFPRSIAVNSPILSSTPIPSAILSRRLSSAGLPPRRSVPSRRMSIF